jgi:cell division protein FtsB
MKISQSEIYLFLTVLALLYLGFNIWRVVNAQRNVKKLEVKIQEYRDKKAELEKSAS